MPTIPQLAAVATALDGKTSDHSSLGTGTEEGYWRRIAKALEDGAGVSNTRNESISGYMERAALAAEATWGGSGAEENSSYAGLLKRIVDAMELQAGVTSGSMSGRMAIAAPLATWTVPLVVAAPAYAVLADQGGGVTRITKGGGVPSTFDASAVSSLGMGDFVLRINARAAGANDIIAGVSNDPLVDNGFNNVRYGWDVTAAGPGYIFESNVARAGPLAAATYFWIWRIGTTLSYGRGATLAIAQGAPDRQVTESQSLYFDSSIYFVGEFVDVALRRGRVSP